MSPPKKTYVVVLHQMRLGVASNEYQQRFCGEKKIVIRIPVLSGIMWFQCAFQWSLLLHSCLREEEEEEKKKKKKKNRLKSHFMFLLVSWRMYDIMIKLFPMLIVVRVVSELFSARATLVRFFPSVNAHMDLETAPLTK